MTGDLSTEQSITMDATIELVRESLAAPELVKPWFFAVETDTNWGRGEPLRPGANSWVRADEAKGVILERSSRRGCWWIATGTRLGTAARPPRTTSVPPRSHPGAPSQESRGDTFSNFFPCFYGCPVHPRRRTTSGPSRRLPPLPRPSRRRSLLPGRAVVHHPHDPELVLQASVVVSPGLIGDRHLDLGPS